MHELGIANSVIEAVRKEAERRPGARVTRVGMCIGECAGVDRESLTFCFEALVKDTELASAVLDIESGARDELDLRYLELEE
ncbi:MAG TPA: hydrogenase maturation nickel metallochaperone HypA [Bryobacteraceae bacterium]|nr:hydrogenase maturation nickel metallochaperone HypA [Bryobacteraceae bacterium]